MYDTALYRFPIFVYRKSIARLTGSSAEDEAIAAIEEDAAEPEAEDAAVQAATATNKNSETRKRKAKAR